jgi:hypothetical protein
MNYSETSNEDHLRAFTQAQIQAYDSNKTTSKLPLSEVVETLG